MKENIIIETIGYISKEEIVASVDYHIIPNTLVLETCDPFPGYHHLDPKEIIPKSIFLVTKKVHGREEVARVVKKIRKYFKYDLDVASSQLSILNETFPALRVKNLESYELIKLLQECFSNEGFVFAKAKAINEKAIIKVKKYFLLKESSIDDICYDMQDNNMAYIKIPFQLSWKLFESITFTVKNNWDSKDFDAAIGILYLKAEVNDVIRVYSSNMEIETLRLIKEKYLKEIEKIE